MIWRFTGFKRVQIVVQDVAFGASWGLIWSSALTLLFSTYMASSAYVIRTSPWIGGILGAVFGFIAGVKFSQTVGSTQELRYALSIYGKATFRINATTSVLLTAVAGFLQYRIPGLVIGLVLGYAVIAQVGNFLSYLYIGLFYRVLSVIFNIHSLARGGSFDVSWTLVGSFINVPFRIVEAVCVRLGISSREKMTGVSQLMKHYDRGIKHDRRNKILES